MNKSTVLTLILSFLIILISCNSEKTEKQKLVDAFKIYVDSLNSEALSKFNIFREETAGVTEGDEPTVSYQIKTEAKELAELINNSSPAEFSQEEKMLLYQMTTTHLGLNMKRDDPIEENEKNDITYLVADDTQFVNLEFEEIEEAIWQLRTYNQGDFPIKKKFNLSTYFTILDANFANKHLVKIQEAYPNNTHFELFQEIIPEPITNQKILTFYTGKRSVAVHLSYDDLLIPDREYKGKRYVGGELIEFDIRTIYNVGKVCPPICPK